MNRSTSRSERTPRLGVVGELATDHSTIAFFTVAFAASWALWVPAATGVVDDVPAVVNGLFVLGAFGPPVAAVVLTWLAGRRVRTFLVEALAPRVSPRWYLLALALPIGYFAVPNAAVYAALGRSFDPSLLPGRVGAFLVGVVVTLVGGGQEELGWRGFALPRLQSDYGPVPATVVVGVAWACWHLPLFLTTWRDTNVPFAAYLPMVVGMAFFFTWLYNVSGSVLVTAVPTLLRLAFGSVLPGGTWSALVIRLTELTGLLVVVGVMHGE